MLLQPFLDCWGCRFSWLAALKAGLWQQVLFCAVLSGSVTDPTRDFCGGLWCWILGWPHGAVFLIWLPVPGGTTGRQRGRGKAVILDQLYLAHRRLFLLTAVLRVSDISPVLCTVFRRGNQSVGGFTGCGRLPVPALRLAGASPGCWLTGIFRHWFTSQAGGQ